MLVIASIVAASGLPPRVNPPARPRSALAAVSLAPAKDNTLYEDLTGSLSNGAGQFFFTGQTNDGNLRRAVLAFDVAGGLPAGSTIISATLTLHVSRATPGNQAVALRRLLTDWGEGASDAAMDEGMGAQAMTGDATWLHTFYNTGMWASPGGDFAASESASAQVGDAAFYTWGSTPQMVADVQAWLDDPTSNHGWVLIGNEAVVQTAKRFDTRENPVPANRPVLRIDYTTPSPPDHPIFLPLIVNGAS